MIDLINSEKIWKRSRLYPAFRTASMPRVYSMVVHCGIDLLSAFQFVLQFILFQESSYCVWILVVILQLSFVDCLFGELYVIFGMFLKLPILTIVMTVITLSSFVAYLKSAERIFLYLFGIFYFYFSPLSFLLILSI